MCGGLTDGDEVIGSCYVWEWYNVGDPDGRGRWRNHYRNIIIPRYMMHAHSNLVFNGKMLLVGGKDKYGESIGKLQLFSNVQCSFCNPELRHLTPHYIIYLGTYELAMPNEETEAWTDMVVHPFHIDEIGIGYDIMVGYGPEACMVHWPNKIFGDYTYYIMGGDLGNVKKLCSKSSFCTIGGVLKLCACLLFSFLNLVSFFYKFRSNTIFYYYR